ncbi:MAG: hypothetical protein DRH12_18530 [Deltaproteobacteria bacterium]|nr:MAG: hypothetical protein DRH12_18530 [Deltaproteobacteria bacterium]
MGGEESGCHNPKEKALSGPKAISDLPPPLTRINKIKSQELIYVKLFLDDPIKSVIVIRMFLCIVGLSMRDERISYCRAKNMF